MASQPLVVGLTGSFAAGCSTAARALAEQRGFMNVKLSTGLHREWERLQPEGSAPLRRDLQDLGNKMRKKFDHGILAQIAIDDHPLDLNGPIVFDGIRNRGEIDVLRDRFGTRFVLFGILADLETRWSRNKRWYAEHGMSEADFLLDEQRDRNEEVEGGQEVELCVDAADVIIDNSSVGTQESEAGTIRVERPDFESTAIELADLVGGRTSRPARRDEVFMSTAYANAALSRCMKRNVGAVLVAPERRGGTVVAVGYNENPQGTLPCIDDPAPGRDHQCLRDIVRNQHFETLVSKGALCPACHEPLQRISGPPWVCLACADRGTKTDLERWYFPDRAMNSCTAVHAEVRAILNAGREARGATLYSTTFPCLPCAEIIAEAGVAAICFTEAYPDALSRSRLQGIVTLRQFEGVRSSIFDRVFRMRPAS